MINLDLKLTDDNIEYYLKNDFIDRNKYINSLGKLLLKLDSGAIISLDGKWGSGKTVFLKELEYLVNNENDSEYKNIEKSVINQLRAEYMVFYFNSWENDSSDNAMLSLIYSLVKGTNLEEEKDKYGATVRLVNIVLKYLSSGFVDFKNDVFGPQWEKRTVIEPVKALEEINDKFKEFITELLVENKNKILIIIDEIDRCKPIFAVDLLENIKHFYDDDRIVFIVGTNNRALSACISKVYGENYDSDLYLDKFFDYNLELPDNYTHSYLLATLEGKTISSSSSKQSVIEISKLYNMSMREVNRYFKAFSMIESETYRPTDCIGTIINVIFIPVLLRLKICNKKDYYNFIAGKMNINEIVEKLLTSIHFQNVGTSILKRKREGIIDTILSKGISTDEARIKINTEITNVIKETYEYLFSGDSEYDSKERLFKLLDIISLLC